MAFKTVSINKERSSANFQQLIAAANYEPERSMSNGRLAGSLLSLTFGLSVIYASVFYAPAFFNLGQILGFSSQDTKLPAIDPERDTPSALSPYLDHFKIRRGYIRRGQALKVDYSLSPGTSMTINVRRCNAPIIIEAFRCQNTEGQEINISGIGPGAKSLIMRNPGFYYFDETVTNMNGSKTDKPYKVIWSRKTLRPTK